MIRKGALTPALPPSRFENCSMQDLQSLGGRRRWLLVAAALVGAVALGAGGFVAMSAPVASPRPGPDAVGPTSAAMPTAAAPTRSPSPPWEQRVSAVRVFSAVGDAFFQDARLQRRPQSLVISKDVGEQLSPQVARALLVVIPVVAADPACAQQATLALDVAATTGGPAEVGVYPGAATSLVDDRLPASGEADVAALLDIRPRGVAMVTEPGLQYVDITALARTWTTGGPFPSTGRRVEPGTPLLLVLRPTAANAGVWSITLSGPPTLTFRSEPACREP